MLAGGTCTADAGMWDVPTPTPISFRMTAVITGISATTHGAYPVTSHPHAWVSCQTDPPFHLK